MSVRPALGGHIVDCQCSAAVGGSLNDFDRIFSVLPSAGFSGWVSIEDGQDPLTGPADIAESALFLRRKMREHGLP